MFFHFLYRNYPNDAYYGYYELLSPAINLRDPNLIKDVLIKDHFSWHRNEQHFSRHFDPLMSYNPFVATGKKWKRSRTILTPLSTAFRVKTLFSYLVDSCNQMTNYLKTFKPMKFATQNVVMCSFSIDSECFSDGESKFNELGKKLFEPTMFGGITLMLITRASKKC